MKKCIIVLAALSLTLGCGTIKKVLGIDKKPDPSPPQEVVENPDGCFSVIVDGSESGGIGFTGYLLLTGVVVGGGLLVRRLVRNKK